MRTAMQLILEVEETHYEAWEWAVYNGQTDKRLRRGVNNTLADARAELIQAAEEELEEL